ncbi:hypothetical protein VTO42DRAFT_5377 [Malbranchea cinnamomea]
MCFEERSMTPFNVGGQRVFHDSHAGIQHACAAIRLFIYYTTYIHIELNTMYVWIRIINTIMAPKVAERNLLQ